MPYKDPAKLREFQKKYAREKRARFKERCMAFRGRACEVCGYDRCSSALAFHHPNDDKSFSIGKALTRPWEEVERELEKCEVLCANCHAERHDVVGWKGGPKSTR